MTTNFTTFKLAPDASLANADTAASKLIAGPLLDRARADSTHWAFFGQAEEDPSTGILVSERDSLDVHKAFHQGP